VSGGAVSGGAVSGGAVSGGAVTDSSALLSPATSGVSSTPQEETITAMAMNHETIPARRHRERFITIQDYVFLSCLPHNLADTVGAW